MTECPIGTIQASGEKVHGISFCLSTQIYINPYKNNLAELGTRESPIKDLSTLMLLVQKIMSFTDASITIFLIEDSIHFMPADISYFLKMNSITIETYSEILPEPGRAMIQFVEGVTLEPSPKSQFAILSDYTTDLLSIISNPELSSAEINEISKAKMGFHFVGTNLTIKRIDLVSNIADPNFMMFNPVYLETKSLTLIDVIMKGYGSILTTNSPLNLYVNGLVMDYYLASKGFDIQID